MSSSSSEDNCKLVKTNNCLLGAGGGDEPGQDRQEVSHGRVDRHFSKSKQNYITIIVNNCNYDLNNGEIGGAPESRQDRTQDTQDTPVVVVVGTLRYEG